jgi:branched-chain amino acid transport system ATP-binding protein
LANNETVLELQDVDSGYGEIEVLKNISIAVQKKTIVSIIGANGAGKSTLLKTIFGVVRPTKGKIILAGDDVTQLLPIETLRRGVSYIPEGRSNFPGLTVQENLEMGAYIRRDRHQVLADADSICRRFPILQEKRQALAGNLSGGQQQMLEIGIALMLRPEVILIDEPTLGLAPILATEVFEAIQDINAQGTTVVLVEQNAKQALEISDYAFVLELGRIRFQGPPSQLASNEEIIDAYLGER